MPSPKESSLRSILTLSWFQVSGSRNMVFSHQLLANCLGFGKSGIRAGLSNSAPNFQFSSRYEFQVSRFMIHVLAKRISYQLTTKSQQLKASRHNFGKSGIRANSRLSTKFSILSAILNPSFKFQDSGFCFLARGTAND